MDDLAWFAGGGQGGIGNFEARSLRAAQEAAQDLEISWDGGKSQDILENPVYKYRDRTYSRLRLSCLPLIYSLSPDLS